MTEYHQAPLYYPLMAALGSLVVGVDTARIELPMNPFYAYEIGISGSDNER